VYFCVVYCFSDDSLCLLFGFAGIFKGSEAQSFTKSPFFLVELFASQLLKCVSDLSINVFYFLSECILIIGLISYLCP
jgi:hypothetical protein